MDNTISRLQIGMSRPSALPNQSLKIFFDSTWINLGDSPCEDMDPKRPKPEAFQQFKTKCKKVIRSLLPAYDIHCSTLENDRILHNLHCKGLENTPFFTPFWWGMGSTLPFLDSSFSFIYSEHFFEHIWQDEAYSLFQECFRVLGPSGVLRIAVPDADLRVYESPEPIAFDAATNMQSNRGWCHPEIHKTRWNIYLLSLLLSLAGFKVRPISYCDKLGNNFVNWPVCNDKDYPGDVDWDMVHQSTYVIRKTDSLVVDAIKEV